MLEGALGGAHGHVHDFLFEPGEVLYKAHAKATCKNERAPVIRVQSLKGMNDAHEGNVRWKALLFVLGEHERTPYTGLMIRPIQSKP